MHMNTLTHVHTYTYTCAYICRKGRRGTSKELHVCVCARACVFVRACERTYMYMCMWGLQRIGK